MRAFFGVVSLLVALAIIGLVASRQLKAGFTPTAAQADGSGASMAPAPTGTPAQQSRQLQTQVKDDIAKALEAGKAQRDEADK